MFKVGDRIEVDRAFGRKVTAVILELQFRNDTYICRVRKEDTGQEDAFAWNIHQDEISVRLAAPEPMVTMTQAEFDRRIAMATAIGFREGQKSANDIAYQNGYGPDEEE